MRPGKPMKRMMKVVMEKVLNLVQGLGLRDLLNLTTFSGMDYIKKSLAIGYFQY